MESTAAKIPDEELYRPIFLPWLANQGEFRAFFEIARPRTLVSPDRCHVIYTLLLQAIHIEGDIWECGVYKGGTAALITQVLRTHGPWKRLFLFDTFEGMPDTDPQRDLHVKGDFSDTSLESVSEYIQSNDTCIFRKGFIPDTFAGLESRRIALAHIDVDIYKSILDSLEFIWPRLSFGGFIIFDDYGFPSCPGARSAVDTFFREKACRPLSLPTGQALIFKGVTS